MSRPTQEHGTFKSYVIGFLLSLLFTFIPYILVVNQTVKGTVLLVAILGFAFTQLLIQVLFFLHLGRGPKPNWNVYFFVATVSLILVVVGASIFIINNLNYNMLPTDQAKILINEEGIYQVEGNETGACQGQHDNHQVTITEEQALPWYTSTNECDTLSFINETGKEIDIVFGNYPDNQTYAGESLLSVRVGRSKTITLSEPGEIHFYVSNDPVVSGYFAVTAE